MLRYYRIDSEPEKLTDHELGVKVWHLKKLRELEANNNVNQQLNQYLQ